jgi:hypothetical protein
VFAIMVVAGSGPILELAPEHLSAIRALASLYERLGKWRELVLLIEREAELSNDQRQMIALLHRACEILEDQLHDEASALKAYEMSPWVFLLAANVLLLLLGCFLEGTTILLVIVPVLLPTAHALGIDPVHFGVVCVVNIMLGLVTPPYGLLLFMMVKIAEVPLRDLVREVLPFLWVMIGALALITFVPDLVLWLPRLLGYKG